MPHFFSKKTIDQEIAEDMLRWKIARERARELVLDRGWTEQDEDFDIQVEEEADRQWEQENEQERRKQARTFFEEL